MLDPQDVGRALGLNVADFVLQLANYATRLGRGAGSAGVAGYRFKAG